MSKDKQIEKLASSRNQLLIALRETTESESFDEIITKEFEGLPDDDTRKLFLIVGFATIARVGIHAHMAKEAYANLMPSRAFDDALSALTGIVGDSGAGRLIARHEVYVRHILDSVSDFASIRSAIRAILRTYLKYNIPVVKNVNRVDAFFVSFALE